MNFLKIDIKKINDPALQDVIHLLEESFKKYNIDFYLIGARARDFWFAANDLTPKRGTRDIDFAVLVSDVKEFDELIKHLIANNDFKPIERIPHRLICAKNNYIIDLMPFSSIGNASYFNFNDRFDTTISVLGFKEVYAESISISLEDKETIKMATLPGLCILKLISWNDRPEEREKDIEDFANILEHYFDIESETIYSKHLDLFDTENFKKEIAAARVLGRQMQFVLNRSEALKQKVVSILNENTVNPDNSKMGTLMIKNSNKYITDAVILLKELLTGITEKIPPVE